MSDFEKVIDRGEWFNPTQQNEPGGDPYAHGVMAGSSLPFPVGDTIGLAADIEMYINDPASREWYNYLMTAAGLLPAIPALATIMNRYADAGGVVRPMNAGNQEGMINAYHGSPHDFDEFKATQIGSGEGAQAYGHGLYFAESEDVAKQYRDVLAELKTFSATDDIAAEIARADGEGRSIEELIRNAKVSSPNDVVGHLRRAADLQDEFKPEFAERSAMLRRGADLLESGDVGFEKATGHMYQVEIDATPDELLDWDAPLSEQSERVKSMLSTSPITLVDHSNGNRQV